MYFKSTLWLVLLFLAGLSSATAITVTASNHDGNVPANTLDNNLSTRWSAQGDGQWIKYDLGNAQTVDDIEIAFYRGDARTAFFDIELSNNNASWQQVFSGQSNRNTRLQRFNITDQSARYVRIVGFGNSSNSWNSLTEVKINVLGSNPPPPPPSSGALWNEGFNLSNGLTEDNGATAWTLNTNGIKSSGYLRVENNRMDARNTGAEVSWISEIIDISGVQNVSITADVEGVGNLDAPDYIEMAYRINGGSINRFGRRNNDLSRTTVNIDNLSGSQLQVLAFFKTSASDEHYYLHDVVVEGSGSGGGQPPPSGGLDPNLPPGLNFNLSQWKITLPDGNDRNVEWLVSGNQSSNEFYTDSASGGMVFRAPNFGSSTTNSSFVRSELREMLRGTDTHISTRGINGNNWVTSAASSSNQNNAGGVDGVLFATLKVDHVSTSGNSSKLGRVVVGQIHGSNDEPLKLFYRKLPDNEKGAVYFTYEEWQGPDIKYPLIGSWSSSASNPSDGISLGEVWSYMVETMGRELTVSVIKQDGTVFSRTITMESDYNNDWMYFKAGVYNQNNTGSQNDYVQATFFESSHTHN